MADLGLADPATKRAQIKGLHRVAVHHATQHSGRMRMEYPEKEGLLGLSSGAERGSLD